MERIDIHCHAVPPGYRQYALDNGHAQPDGMPAMPAWSPEDHIALMKQLNITKSVLSITSPGTHLTPSRDSQAAEKTRETNEELSNVCSRYASHFAFFASLPLPSVHDSIAEIDYALDHLGATGFAMLSNSNGVYLGDTILEPVFAKLNARKAIIFIHPTTCSVLGPKGEVEKVQPLPQHPRPMMEFMFDETRAVANLLLSGTVARHPDITFVMSHCGCALPPILDRIGSFAALGGIGDQRDGFRKLLRERFFFDLAGYPFPDQIHGLLRILGNGAEKRLLYGTDYPFTPGKAVAGSAKQIDQGCTDMFDEDQRLAIYSGNASRLLGMEDSSSI